MTDTTATASSSVSLPDHVAGLVSLMNDSDFGDFVTGAFEQVCDAAGRAIMNPMHYFALVLFGFFDGCRSDEEIHERASNCAPILELLDREIEEKAPSAEAIGDTRRVLGPRAHAAAVAWVINGREWGSAATATAGLSAMSVKSFLEYLERLQRNSVTGRAVDSVGDRRGRPLERRLSSALLKTVFAFAGNVVTTGLIAGTGIWLLGVDVPGASRDEVTVAWSPGVSLAVSRIVRATAVVTLLLGLLLVAMLLFDARRRVRELNVPEPVRTVVIVALAIIIVLVMVLATLKQAGG